MKGQRGHEISHGQIFRLRRLPHICLHHDDVANWLLICLAGRKTEKIEDIFPHCLPSRIKPVFLLPCALIHLFTSAVRIEYTTSRNALFWPQSFNFCGVKCPKLAHNAPVREKSGISSFLLPANLEW